MADNRDLTALSGYCAGDEVSYSGQTDALVQLIKLVGVTGSEGSKTVTEVTGTAGSPGTAVLTIQGVGSGTAVPVSIASVPSHAVTNAGTFAVQATIGTTSSSSHLVAAGSTNATNVKASAGTLLAVHAYNVAATPRYIKFHNTAGTPTAGSGVVLTIALEAGTHRDIVFPQGGRAFSTGIAFTIVTGIADNDTGAVTASDVVLDLEYA